MFILFIYFLIFHNSVDLDIFLTIRTAEVKAAKILRDRDNNAATKFAKTRRQVPVSRHLILVRSRLQLEFKLECRGGATHARYRVGTAAARYETSFR